MHMLIWSSNVAVPEKFLQVKKDLSAVAWPKGNTVQDVVADMIGNGKVDTDAFFVAGNRNPKLLVVTVD